MPDERPNLVVVISHDLGQHMGCYGVPGVRTPSFDGFAARGIRFANSFCTAPQCSPSRAALWTGRHPHANGVVGLAQADFWNDLHPGERHLAQILAEAGYRTELCGAQHVSPYPERCGFQGIDHTGGPCRTVAARACRILESWDAGRGSLFLQAAFSEPHRPFAHADVDALDPATMWVPPYLPDIPEVREDLADLEASVSSADRAFGAIVDAVDRGGLADNTIVVFTVDHGVAFPHAKMHLYDPGIEVALLMRVPGLAGGKVYSQMISNVDFVPTILELVGLPVPANVQGRSFKALLGGDAYEPRDAVFAEKTYHAYYDPMRAIRTERWKLIANFEFAPQQELVCDLTNNHKSHPEIIRAKPPLCHFHPPLELYDLVADPCEQTNLAGKPELADVRDDLVRRLRRWMQDTRDPLLEGPIAQATYRRRMAAFMQV